MLNDIALNSIIVTIETLTYRKSIAVLSKNHFTPPMFSSNDGGDIDKRKTFVIFDINIKNKEY